MSEKKAGLLARVDVGRISRRVWRARVACLKSLVGLLALAFALKFARIGAGAAKVRSAASRRLRRLLRGLAKCVDDSAEEHGRC